MKDHLGGTHKNVSACPQVPKEVKQEMLDFLKNFSDMKHMAQRNFEEWWDPVLILAVVLVLVLKRRILAPVVVGLLVVFLQEEFGDQ